MGRARRSRARTAPAKPRKPRHATWTSNGRRRGADRLPGEDVFLASIAGYVDTLGFVALFGLFTAHVTGNFILIGSSRPGSGKGC